MASKGILVVLDGIDGCGKSTQVKLLDERLREAGFPRLVAREPTDGPWGTKLRESAGQGRLEPAEELEVILNDRRDDVELRIGPGLSEGAIVILDRYYTSTIAYQGLRGFDPAEIQRKNEEFAPRPDIIFLFTLDATLAHGRISERGDEPEAFENTQELAEVSKRFDQLELPGIVRLDALLARDQLNAIIYRIVLQRYLFGTQPPSGKIAIPTIDLMGGLAVSRDPATVANQISQACQRAGFFRIVNHGIPSALLQTNRRLARLFFSQSDTIKLKAYRQDRGRGFQPLSNERLSATVGDSGPGDLKETFNVGPDDGRNLWPSVPPDFEPNLRALFDALSNLSETLLELFAHALQLPSDIFLPFNKGAKAILRLNHYPRISAPVEPGQMRATPHTDYGSLTVLSPDDAVGGLQVYLPNQHWMDIECPADGFVINIGNLMERWTNGRWASTIHQVIVPDEPADGQSDRLSLALLHNPNQQTTILPFDGCLGSGGESAYLPVIAKDYLARKSIASRSGATRPTTRYE